MATTEAQRRASKKWQQENRANMSYQTTKERREEIREYAASAGISINKLFDNAVTEYINNHPVID